MSAPDLAEVFDLEQIDDNRFRGRTPQGASGPVFGGQVIAQALLAAYRTVDAGRPCHSLHSYFLRPGDPRIPILYEVDRARDGGSFTMRRVVAVQHGKQIFNLSASFQTPVAGFEHQVAAPPHTGWAEMESERRVISRAFPQLVETRTVEGTLSPAGRQPPHNQTWFRARETLTGVSMHQAALAYASDMGLLSTAIRPHPVDRMTPGLQIASLDHAVWFHRPFDFNQWHLYVQDSPISTGARGYVRGAVYSEDGALVASALQEGLLRPPRGG